MNYFANLKSTLLLLIRLIWQTFLPGKDSIARLTIKRFAIMSIFLPVFCLVQILHWIGFLFDELFFSRYRQVEIKEPLFIIGIPRSGTTFLHRILANDDKNWTTFTLWELILTPSITERKFWLGMAKFDRFLGRPVTKLITWILRSTSSSLEPIHAASIYEPEEDFMSLIPVLSCFLLVHPFPFPEMWRLAFFDEQVSESEKKRIMTFYRSCLQRHLYFHGEEKRILSKNASFCPTIRAIKNTFPDCKIIMTVRNPIESVPSFLSVMYAGARLFDNNRDGHLLRDKTLEILRYFHNHLLSTLSEWPSNQYVIIKMEEMIHDINSSVSNTYHHFNIPLSPLFKQYLTDVTLRSRKYVSRHHYSLAEYELDERDIYRDYSEIFTRFNYDSKK